MKAVRFHEHGGPDVLRYEDAPESVPTPTQVQLAVRAVALNQPRAPGPGSGDPTADG